MANNENQNQWPYVANSGGSDPTEISPNDIEGLCKRFPASPNDVLILRDAFVLFDKDQNNCIDVGELQYMLAALMNGKEVDPKVF